MSNSNERPCILVVDDDVYSLKALGEAFADAYQVLVAKDGAEAVKIAQENSPDLIILDILMPGIDGYQVLDALREDVSTQNIPVIFLTVKDEPIDEASGLNRGAVDYWTKPFSAPIARARARTQLELKDHRDRLARQAMTDGLTGVLNRRALDDVCAREFRRSQRNGWPLAFILADVDHFKLYNDHYGHQAGDDCLKQVARAIEASMARAGDAAARFGGEEFACVLPETDEAGALKVATQIQTAVAALKIEHAQSKTAAYVSISIGVALTSDPDTRDAAALVKHADAALYQAKAQGRDRVVRFDA